MFTSRDSTIRSTSQPTMVSRGHTSMSRMTSGYWYRPRLKNTAYYRSVDNGQKYSTKPTEARAVTDDSTLITDNQDGYNRLVNGTTNQGFSYPKVAPGCDQRFSFVLSSDYTQVETVLVGSRGTGSTANL
jgi:hypothetical protein